MHIAGAFHRAGTYDRHADVQHDVARQLATHILTLDLPPEARILEVGCGTGFLGAGLIGRLPYGRYWMTDIAPGMIERARRRFAGRDNLVITQMDAAAPTIEGPFDLICSNLALQWIADLPRAVARLRGLLAPQGRLIFTTLAAGTFSEWRAAYGAATPGTPDYPAAEDLRALGLEVSIETIGRKHASAREFLVALKAIGANTPRAGYQPLPPGQLRDVMTRFEADGATARYVVATCVAGPLP